MSVVRFKVVEVLEPFDGKTCIIKAECIGFHKDFMLFSSAQELKIGEEFQENNFTKRLTPFEETLHLCGSATIIENGKIVKCYSDGRREVLKELEKPTVDKNLKKGDTLKRNN